MNTPVSSDLAVALDLETIANELRTEQAYVREGHAARTLIRLSDLRIVVIALKAGKTMSEHHADVTASVQTLSGHIRLQLPDRRVDLPVGHLLVLGTGVPHDVSAESDSTFLLTLGWPATHHT